MAYPTVPLLERFENSFIPEPMSGCFLWIGSVKGNKTHPYGGIFKGPRWAGDKTNYGMAHRVSWELYRGAIPSGMKVLHRCDVTLCVNPDHLFLGTTKDNADDMIRKGRYPVRRGERHPLSKLTEQQVLYIRTSGADDETIAAEFGVRATAISRIRTGRRWAHAGGPIRAIAPCGRRNLTIADRVAIRASVQPQNLLARKYGVDQSTISRIRAR